MQIYAMRPGFYKGMPRVWEDDKVFSDDFLGASPKFRKNFDKNPNYYKKYHIELDESVKYQVDDTMLQSPSKTFLVSEKVKNVFEQDDRFSFLDFAPVTIQNVKKNFYLMLLDKVPVIDCLDREKSKLDYCSIIPDNVDHIYQYAFYTDKIKDNLIFKVPEHSVIILVREEVINLLKNAGIKGFDFAETQTERYEKICNGWRNKEDEEKGLLVVLK